MKSGVLSSFLFIWVGFLPDGVWSEWGFAQWGFAPPLLHSVHYLAVFCPCIAWYVPLQKIQVWKSIPAITHPPPFREILYLPLHYMPTNPCTGRNSVQGQVIKGLKSYVICKGEHEKYYCIGKNFNFN